MAKRPNKKRRKKPDPWAIEGGLEHVLAMRLDGGRRPTVEANEKLKRTWARRLKEKDRLQRKATEATFRAMRRAKRHPVHLQRFHPRRGSVEIVGGRRIDMLVVAMDPGTWYTANDIGELMEWPKNVRQTALYRRALPGGYVERRRLEGMPAGRLKGQFNGILGPRILFCLTPKGEDLARLNRMLE